MMFYNQMQNATYLNGCYYFPNNDQITQYQHEQDQEVINFVKAATDMYKAAKKLDLQHQQQAFNLCLAMIAIEFGCDNMK